MNLYGVQFKLVRLLSSNRGFYFKNYWLFFHFANECERINNIRQCWNVYRSTIYRDLFQNFDPGYEFLFVLVRSSMLRNPMKYKVNLLWFLLLMPSFDQIFSQFQSTVRQFFCAKHTTTKATSNWYWLQHYWLDWCNKRKKKSEIDSTFNLTDSRSFLILVLGKESKKNVVKEQGNVDAAWPEATLNWFRERLKRTEDNLEQYMEFLTYWIVAITIVVTKDIIRVYVILE